MIGDSITHNWESERNYEQTFAGENLLNLGFAGDRIRMFFGVSRMERWTLFHQNW